MLVQTKFEDIRPSAGKLSLPDKWPMLFVFSVYFFMVLAAFFCVVRYGRNIPLAEDWLMVAPLTGNESDFWGWLWAQNNEHRIPLPKLILLGLLYLSGGDFRIGMFFNVTGLSILALVIILFLRKHRNYIRYTDAFFPLILLHIGNWENLVWSWQLSFVLPALMTVSFFLILLKNPLLNQLAPAVFAAILLLLFPLCGGNGLLLVPFLALYLLYCGVREWRRGKNVSHLGWVNFFLIAASLVSVLVSSLYFVGYTRPTWNPPSPGILETMLTAVKFLALSFGPATKPIWLVFGGITIVLLISTSYLGTNAMIRSSDPDKRQKAVCMLLFLAILSAFALAIGWGRAGLVPQYGMPIRYVLLSSPLLIICYFAWEWYGTNRIRTMVQTFLFLSLIVLVPLNTKAGFEWRNWYAGGMMAVEKDLLTGVTAADLAKRHKDFLIHWWDENHLLYHLEMLRSMKHSPFSALKPPH